MLRVLYILVSDRPIRDSHIQPIEGWAKRQVSLTYVFYAPRGEELIPAPGCDAAFYPTYSRSKLTFPQDAVRLASELHRQRPFHLVVADDPMGSGLAACFFKYLFHIPLLIKVHTQYFGHLNWVLERPYHPFYYLMAPFVLAQADMVKAVSRSVQSSLLPLGVAPGKIEVCPTPVRSHFFDSSPRPPGQPFREKLLNVGYLYRGKGLDLLLQAMQLLVQAGKNPSLTLVGDGPERPALERLAERLAIRDRVIFVGHVPKNFLSPFYRGNDIFVLPTRYEGLGKVLIEAALTGLPVVTTDIGPTAEAVLPDETALLVPPNDPRALAIAINALLEHPEQARTMGERGRRFARRHFDYEGMMDDLVALWHRVYIKGSHLDIN